MLIDRYQAAIDDLLKTVRETQRETIVKAGEMVADAVEKGGKLYFLRSCTRHTKGLDIQRRRSHFL